MKKLLITTALLGAVGASPAYARLQLTVSDGTQTFSCFDGELSCDSSGGVNNLALLNPFSDGTEVQFTLTISTFGTHNELQLSSDNITTTSARTITFIASDTGFNIPVSSIQEAASLTFNSNVGAGASKLQFWADSTNTQGADPINTPGTLLDTVTGTPLTDPDSFAGVHNSPFFSSTPFSMTEGASLAMIAGGSVTGFNDSMTSSSIPEPRTWALSLIGFGLLAAMGWRRSKVARYAL